MYTVLLDVPRFTHNIQAQINSIQDEMKRSTSIFPESVGSSIDHYNNLLNVKGTLAELRVANNNMRSKLISIQVMIIPHFDLM